MKREDLKALIRETIEEYVSESGTTFAPLGVANEAKGISSLPKGMRDALEKKYGKGTPEFFKHAQKLVYAKNEGHPKVNEMWMALEGKGHDETDMSNPEEKREVELAKKAKDAADAILKMHGK